MGVTSVRKMMAMVLKQTLSASPPLISTRNGTASTSVGRNTHRRTPPSRVRASRELRLSRSPACAIAIPHSAISWSRHASLLSQWCGQHISSERS